MTWQGSSEALSPDWVYTSSNVHACNDRNWFDEFTTFSSFALGPLSQERVNVEGVGTVNLPVKRGPSLSGPRAHHVLRLTNVLYIPSSICNIIGGPVFDFATQVSFGTTANSLGSLTDVNGRLVAYFAPNQGERYLLKISGPPIGPRLAPSKFQSNRSYVVRVSWPGGERQRWENRPREAMSPAQQGPWIGEKPYVAAEKAWLKSHYGGEFKFLAAHQLSIYREQDRAEGRALMRTMNARDGDGNGEEEDQPQDGDAEHDRRMLALFDHAASHHFDARELNWIARHWGGIEAFMFSQGLEIDKDVDCEMAGAIVRAYLISDESEDVEVVEEDDDGVDGDDEDDDDDDDNHEDEDDEDEDVDSWDPESHFADHYFNEQELGWIKKHYRDSATFMFTFGLKFYDDEDCAVAKNLVRSFLSGRGLIGT